MKTLLTITTSCSLSSQVRYQIRNLAMSVSSKVLYLFGTLLLLHSAYSSFQFIQITKFQSIDVPIPKDIKAEVIVGMFLFVVGSIFSIRNTPLLSVNNEIVDPAYSYLKPIEMRKATVEFEKIGINPFEEIDSKPAFINILERRKLYRDWASVNNI